MTSICTYCVFCRKDVYTVQKIHYKKLSRFLYVLTFGAYNKPNKTINKCEYCKNILFVDYHSATTYQQYI